MKPNPPTGFTAPHSQEAEEATIGSVLVNPKSFMVLSTILKPEDFFLLRHNYIWQAFGEITKRNQPIDFVLITEELANMKLLDDVGGYAYLIQVANNTPSSINAEAYARLVEATSVRRKLLIVADDIKKLAVDETLILDDVFIQTNLALTQAQNTYYNTKKQGKWASQAMNDMDERILLEMQTDVEQNNLTTGIADLDAMLRGSALEPERLIVLAGRPGMGKTAAMLTCILANASRGNVCGLVTTEMSTEQILRRMIAILSGVTVTQQSNPRNLTEEQWARRNRARDYIANLPIRIEDKPNPKPKEIEVYFQQSIENYRMNSLYIDGIYRMNSDIDTKGNNHQKFGSIANALKTLARTYNINVWATHQLSRAVEDRAQKRPLMSDLRESGTIEEEADAIIFMYRDEVYDAETLDQNIAELIVAKNRDGQSGTVRSYFDKERMTMKDLTKISLKDL